MICTKSPTLVGLRNDKESTEASARDRKCEKRAADTYAHVSIHAIICPPKVTGDALLRVSAYGDVFTEVNVLEMHC